MVVLKPGITMSLRFPHQALALVIIGLTNSDTLRNRSLSSRRKSF